MFPGPERPDPRGFGGRDLGAGRYADRRLGERSPSPSRVTQCDYCPSSHNSSAIAGRHAHGRFRVRHRARRHRRRDPTAHPGCSDPCLVRHAVWPGRPGALLRPAPLRTGRARFRASGSSKPRGLADGQKCWAVAGPGVIPVAVCVHKAECSLVRCSVRPHDDGIVDYCLAGDRQPLFPFARALRWPVSVEQ